MVIDNPVWEPGKQAAAGSISECLVCSGKFNDSGYGCEYFIAKTFAQPKLFDFIVGNGIIEFSFSRLEKPDLHS